jgi:hypothetical protein
MRKSIVTVATTALKIIPLQSCHGFFFGGGGGQVGVGEPNQYLQTIPRLWVKHQRKYCLNMLLLARFLYLGKINPSSPGYGKFGSSNKDHP